MIEINATLISFLAIVIGLICTMVGIYVNLTNRITDLTARIKFLEESKLNIWKKLAEHDQDIQESFQKIQEGIARLELLIEKKRNV